MQAKNEFTVKDESYGYEIRIEVTVDDRLKNRMVIEQFKKAAAKVLEHLNKHVAK